MVRMQRQHIAASILLPVIAAIAYGCNPKVSLEGGEKPIHIVMDVNIKVDRELDNFFAFENKYDHNGAATQPSTVPSTSDAK